MDGWNIFWGLISFGSLAYSTKQQMNINKTDKKLKSFAKTKTFSPRDLANGIKEKEAYLVNQFKEYGRNEISGRVFVEGLPFTELPLTGKIERQKLLLSLYFKEDIFSNDRLKASREDNKKFNAPSNVSPESVPSFKLRDYDGSGEILVKNNNNDEPPNYDYALELIASKEEYRKLSFVEKLLVYLFILWEYLGNGGGLRGIKIGIREKEVGIKIENFLTVYGEVIYNFEKKQLRIENPEYFLKNKTRLMEGLREYILSCKAARFLSGLLGVFCIGIIGYRLYQNNRRRAVAN